MSIRFPFRSFSVGSAGPAIESVAITPSNTEDLPVGIRAITINGAGTVSWINWEGAECTTGPLPVGTYTMCARRILATGTTATGITGWA